MLTPLKIDMEHLFQTLHLGLLETQGFQIPHVMILGYGLLTTLASLRRGKVTSKLAIRCKDAVESCQVDSWLVRVLLQGRSLASARKNLEVCAS